MRITSLAENLVYSSRLRGEHGLSLLVETDDGSRLLVDTGLGYALCHNMEALGIQADSVDAVCLTHGHYDHTGGLEGFLQLRSVPVPVYARREMFCERYSRNGSELKQIGIPGTAAGYEKLGADFRWSDSVSNLGGITIMAGITAGREKARFDNRLMIMKNGSIVADDFDDELTYIFDTRKGAVIVTGCAHNGISEIVESAADVLKSDSIYAVVGGAHLSHASVSYIDRTIEVFRQYDVERICLNHCTGFDAAARLKAVFGERFTYLWSGRSIEL
ncbi:MAG: MBL fold metallo-hydrolase [Spirochaetota bacterium]